MYNPKPHGPGPYREIWDRNAHAFIQVTIGSAEETADRERTSTRRRTARRVFFILSGIAAATAAQLWAVSV